MLAEITPEQIANLTDSQKLNIQIVQSLNSMNTAINDVRHDVSVHDKLLISGNGVPSMQERLRDIEKYIEGIKFWSRFIGGAIVLQTLAFFIGIIIAMIRFLPVLEKIASTAK
jgi:hypothetical protein